MAKIINVVSSVTINTATNMIADVNNFGVVVVDNLHATADLYVNVGADAVSTGTIAGALVKAGQTLAIPVRGNRVSMASPTASVPVAYFEKP